MKRLVGERGEWRVEVERLREVQRSRSTAVQEQCESAVHCVQQCKQAMHCQLFLKR